MFSKNRNPVGVYWRSSLGSTEQLISYIQMVQVEKAVTIVIKVQTLCVFIDTLNLSN